MTETPGASAGAGEGLREQSTTGFADATLANDDFRLLADNLPTLAWMANADGYIFWYNRRWHEYCGTTPEQMQGWGWQSVHDPQVLPEVLARWRASIAAGAPFEMTFPLRGRDGVFRPFLTRIVPLRGHDGLVTRWFGTNTDVSPQVAAEAALRAERDRSQGILDSMAEGFALLDRDFRILAVNAEGLRLDGRPREALVGRTHWEAFPGTEGSELGRLYRRAMAERVPVALEHRYAWPDGHATWLEMRAYPAPEGLALFYRDVTDRKRAEEALRASEERLRLVVDGAADYAILTTDRERRVTGWSAGAAAVFGYTTDEILGRPSDVLFTPEDRAAGAPEREAEQASREGYAPDVRWHWRRDSTRVFLRGSVRPLRDGAGHGVGLLKIARDETEARRAEERLRESEARLRALVSASSEVLYAMSPDWAEMRQLTGGTFLADAEGPNRAWLDEYIPADEQPRVLAAIQDAVRAKGVFELEHRVRRADGGLGWTLSRAVPLLDAAGEVTEWFGAASDVTARKAAEEALREANATLEARVAERTAALRQAVDALHAEAQERERVEAALRQAQKMEAVGQLTGGLAHDFNNLLTGITGSLERMQARIAQGRIGDVERYVVVAQGAAKRAAALTHRLLAFSRRQTLDPRPTDVNRLVAGMEELIRRTVGPAIAVEVVAAGGLWTTLIDPGQLENALLNLCINARDAMPDGGKLTIETGNKWLDQRAARGRDLEPGQYVSLCVSDTGLGMTPDVIARAFDPFYTTKPIGMGTGLGLSMVYGFARQSGGQARIYSEPGHGAMVCLYLPRHHGGVEGADDRADERRDEAPRAGQGKTVLVVDDEPAVRMLVGEVLEELGCAAIEAEDGAAGLRVLRSDARVDLLITDVGLPGGMNGRQVADAGRAARPGLKVLFITGYAENAAVGNGHLEPGMQVLTKPFALDALAARVRAIVETS